MERRILYIQPHITCLSREHIAVEAVGIADLLAALVGMVEELRPLLSVKAAFDGVRVVALRALADVP